jgi:hypothetical protein
VADPARTLGVPFEPAAKVEALVRRSEKGR